MEHFFVPFILSALKELKCEFLQFLIMPEMSRVIEQLKVIKGGNDLYDFTRLSSDQYMVFRHAFVTERMFIDTYKVVENPRAMDMLLSVLCMVLCGRVPKGVVPFKTDQLIPKIRMVNPPRGLDLKDRVVEENGVKSVVPKNTNERAVVRVLVPKRKMTLSEVDAEQKQTIEAERAKSPATDEERKKEGEAAGEEKKEEEAKPEVVEDEPLQERWIESD